MKVVILAGGFGTRLKEETHRIPKPMIKIGDNPILWHIMMRYYGYGIKEFIICAGYKKEVILNYFNTKSQNIEDKSHTVNEKFPSDCIVNVVDTGLNTMTGGRLKRVEKYLDDKTFCLTYGDTLNDLNIAKLINFHKKKKRMATVTASKPPGRFGILKIENDEVQEFKEKPMGDDNWVNGGYFVLEPMVLDYIHDDSTVFEHEPIQRLVKEKQLAAFRHSGFYQPMDTIYDKNHLEELWSSGNAYWKTWK